VIPAVLIALLATASPQVIVDPPVVRPGSKVTIMVIDDAFEVCLIDIRDPEGNIILSTTMELDDGRGEIEWDVPRSAKPGDYSISVVCRASSYASYNFEVLGVESPPLVGGEVRRDYSHWLTSVTLIATLALAYFAFRVEIGKTLQRL